MSARKLRNGTTNIQRLLLLFLNNFYSVVWHCLCSKLGMKQGDRSRVGKMHLISIILSGFWIISSLPVIATQNVTLSLRGVTSVGVSQSQGSGLSVDATSQLSKAQSVAIAWNPSVSPNVAGYDIYYGGVSGIYTNELFAGNVTNITIPGLEGGDTYYFLATAVSSAGVQSTFSSQLAYTVSSVPALGLPVFSSSGFSFPVTGITGSNCVIQVSTNLTQWIPLLTNTVPFQFTDSNANHFSRRFYRAVYP